MKLTGLEVFDLTIQRTNTWLKELMQELNWSDRRKTFAGLRCVLHALRDHLSTDHAVYLGEQFPTLIRGVYYEHWNPVGKPRLLRSQEDFFSALECNLARDGEHTSDAEAMTRAVFRLLERKVSEGEIQDVHNIIPRELTNLWPPTLRAA